MSLGSEELKHVTVDLKSQVQFPPVASQVKSAFFIPSLLGDQPRAERAWEVKIKTLTPLTLYHLRKTAKRSINHLLKYNNTCISPCTPPHFFPNRVAYPAVAMLREHYIW